MVRNSTGVMNCCICFFNADCEIGDLYIEGQWQRLRDSQNDNIDDFD
jgi:hypothetical protein